MSLGGCLPQFGEHITVAVILLLGGRRQANYVTLNSLPLSNVRNGIESKGCVLKENSLACNPSIAVCGDFIAINSPWKWGVNPVIRV